MPPGVVTDTFTVPTACAGATAVSCVELTTMTLVAAVDPKLTAVAPVRNVPVTVTVFPPASGPAAGDTAVTRPGQFGTDVRVRHLVGIDPGRGGVAIADRAQVGAQLAYCARNVEAARRDLVRICTEIREELEPETQPLAQALPSEKAIPRHSDSSLDASSPSRRTLRLPW